MTMQDLHKLAIDNDWMLVKQAGAAWTYRTPAGLFEYLDFKRETFSAGFWWLANM